jgi:hypothetical protein
MIPGGGQSTTEALDPGGGEHLAQVPAWAERQGFAGNPKDVSGAKVFAQVGCLNCHTYLGAVNPMSGRPTSQPSGSPVVARRRSPPASPSRRNSGTT